MSQVVDKRVERSKAAVLAEVYRQLTQTGISGVSIDEVSRVSGVAKTTIYRHWPSRSALLIDACSRLGSGHPPPDTGTLRTDLHALATGLADQLQTSTWASVYPSIIDATERDSEIAALQAELHNAFMAPFRAVIAQAKDRGEIQPNQPDADLVASVVGPLFYRRWFSKEVIDERFIKSIVDAAVNANLSQ
ncbi:TetR/AcrR family transcriptional regulator [Luteibacter aegosomatis]|uniref:TetR/AcrR family transcriptional regulator n=1 Tax=Luteibacter aegosomatis TaxID=2911537 RepID=UPI001FF7C666|nr:TetR/AcrR family transcriptional regulator [Luteibacter aegosomatis]UPG87462.1 TetR/AcrR family transcriptional regulator [Luteibacter aegosomatis]